MVPTAKTGYDLSSIFLNSMLEAVLLCGIAKQMISFVNKFDVRHLQNFAYNI